jgi:hypothetical protein
MLQIPVNFVTSEMQARPVIVRMPGEAPARGVSRHAGRLRRLLNSSRVRLVMTVTGNVVGGGVFLAACFSLPSLIQAVLNLLMR